MIGHNLSVNVKVEKYTHILCFNKNYFNAIVQKLD